MEFSFFELLYVAVVFLLVFIVNHRLRVAIPLRFSWMVNCFRARKNFF